jgi:hypothetical protein
MVEENTPSSWFAAIFSFLLGIGFMAFALFYHGEPVATWARIAFAIFGLGVFSVGSWLLSRLFRVSTSEARVAKTLYDRFRGSAIDDSMAPAAEIESHFDDLWNRKPKDEVGRFLLDWLVPKVNTPAASHVVDFTEGRPDTLAWLTLMLITQRGQLYYGEYCAAVESKIKDLGCQRIHSPTLGKTVKLPGDQKTYRWVVGILRSLIEKSDEDTSKDLARLLDKIEERFR